MITNRLDFEEQKTVDDAAETIESMVSPTIEDAVELVSEDTSEHNTNVDMETQ